MNFEGDFCRLHFRVKSLTEIGQVVAISGNNFALGNYKKDKVVQLVTTPESYPIWYTASPIVIPRGEIVHYRYCLVESGAVKAFEKLENSREFIADELDTVIEGEFTLLNLEGYGMDSEMELFAQMKKLTSQDNEVGIDVMDWSQNSTTMKESSLYLVCYHLPVTVTRTNRPIDPFEVSWNDSIIARGDTSIASAMRTVWVGTLSVSLNALAAHEKTYLLALLQKMDCIPVVLDDEVAAAAYYGFCKNIMWPIFHNVDQLDHIHAAWNLQDAYRGSKLANLPPAGSGTTLSGCLSSGYMSSLAGHGNNSGLRSRSGSIIGSSNGGENNRVLEWNNLEENFHVAYEAVNQIFARTLLDIVHDNDVVWVHDYHLMILPKLLRDSLSSSNEPHHHCHHQSSSTTESATNANVRFQ